MFSFFQRRRLTIPTPRHSLTRQGLHRVDAVVAGSRVFFESLHRLSPAAESLGSAFLLPAMRQAMRVRMESAVCPRWVENLRPIQELTARWWNLPQVALEASPRKTRASDAEEAAPRGTALFFTGGVDSFHTLLQLHQSLDALVFVAGLDVPLRDAQRLRRVREQLSVVAAEKRTPVIVVRTNLRRHRLFRSVGWPMAHGAALAAVGHLLATDYSTAVIASTDVLGPHGTHPTLDPLWSSASLAFRTHGKDVTRLSKARVIVQDRTVLKTLRVCWRHQSRLDLNCGYCEKCLRTLLQMHISWEQFAALQTCFPARDIVRELDRQPNLPLHLTRQWRDIVEHLTDLRLRGAVERLLRRGRRTLEGQAA